MRTPDSITQYSPMRTPAPTMASGCTRAVWAITAEGSMGTKLYGSTRGLPGRRRSRREGGRREGSPERDPEGGRRGEGAPRSHREDRRHVAGTMSYASARI